MIIVGIALVSGVFVSTYHYVSHVSYEIPTFPQTAADFVYPYASLGSVLGILGLIVLIFGILLLLVKPQK
jgi:hypothetical protein